MQVSYENHYLTDNDVANFARQSFGKSANNFSDEQNANLIKFLARGMKSSDWESLINDLDQAESMGMLEDLAVYLRKIPEHWVPFGHPHITLNVSAPVPIRTQIYKHKIGFVESEESRRYIKSEPRFYLPEHFRSSAKDVKQGSSDEPHERNTFWMNAYNHACEQSLDNYMGAINDGVCPEQARFFLVQGTEVNWTWTGSLYAYANFFNQRNDSHAQKEVRVLANQVNDIIKPLYPVSWPALTAGEY